MLWPDGWGLWGRLTFQQQLKKGAGGGRWGLEGQVCTGQTGSPRIPAPPLARGGGISLEVRAAALFFHRAEVTEVICMSPKHTSMCSHMRTVHVCEQSQRAQQRNLRGGSVNWQHF